uniref:Secreted protein n=1 Tax=Ascaris lumbricoides TaxID=6252 RepID=A0A0M3I663_ASCLU
MQTSPRTAGRGTVIVRRNTSTLFLYPRATGGGNKWSLTSGRRQHLKYRETQAGRRRESSDRDRQLLQRP